MITLLECLYIIICLFVCLLVQSLRRVWLFQLNIEAYQAPLSIGFTGKDTGAGCHFLLQGISPNQGSNTHLLNCRRIPHP